MPITCVLLHMASDDCARERLTVAVEVARRHGARLAVAYMVTPAAMPAAITGRGASAAYIAEAAEVAAEEAGSIRAEVEAACRAAGVGVIWEQLDGDHNELLAARSHYADVVVISQSHGLSMDDYVGVHQPGELLLESACPVLVVPRGARPRTVGDTILIAWKQRREATRAVREAMPFLEAARTITLLTCDGPDGTGDGGRTLLAFLAQHGLQAHHISDPADDGDAGPAILGRAAEAGADLIVMGAFGRPRWREMVLGGVTAHVLAHMTIPVLMAH